MKLIILKSNFLTFLKESKLAIEITYSTIVSNRGANTASAVAIWNYCGK